jgi:hypothetical protein
VASSWLITLKKNESTSISASVWKLFGSYGLGTSMRCSITFESRMPFITWKKFGLAPALSRISRPLLTYSEKRRNAAILDLYESPIEI